MLHVKGHNIMSLAMFFIILLKCTKWYSICIIRLPYHSVLWEYGFAIISSCNYLSQKPYRLIEMTWCVKVEKTMPTITVNNCSLMAWRVYFTQAHSYKVPSFSPSPPFMIFLKRQVWGFFLELRVSQPWHFWRVGPGNSLLYEGILCGTMFRNCSFLHLLDTSSILHLHCENHVSR